MSYRRSAYDTPKGGSKSKFVIFATAGASDFKFDAPLGFVKAHHKITPIEKVSMALG